MTKTFEANGRPYTAKPIQPWVQPYLTAYSQLAKKQPQTAEEAEQISEEIRKVLGKILALVEPQPPDEDVWPVFIGLMKHIRQSRTEAAERFFRKGSAEGGGSAGDEDRAAAVGAPRDGSGRVRR